MSSPPSSAASRALVLLGALCLSLSALMVKGAGVSAPTTAFLRCGIAVVTLWPLAWRERRVQGRMRRPTTVWAGVAGLALGLDYAAWTAAIFDVGAGVSTVLINVQVLVLPLLAFVVDREPLTRRFLVALPVLGLGVTMIGAAGHEVGRQGQHALRGTALGVLAGVGYGVYLFLSRRAGRANPAVVLQPLAWATGAAAAVTALLSLPQGGLHVHGLGLRAWGILVALALLGQVVAWLLIHHGSPNLPAATTATLLLVQPVLTLALGAALLGERPHAGQLAGMTLVLAAVGSTTGAFTARSAHNGNVAQSGHVDEGRASACVGERRRC